MRPLLLVLVSLDAPTWERDIQPLFDEHCRGCHSAKVTMGSLDLETYEGVRRGGNHGVLFDGASNCRIEKCKSANKDYSDQVGGSCATSVGIQGCWDRSKLTGS
jgi:hypothetical protein